MFCYQYQKCNTYIHYAHERTVRRHTLVGIFYFTYTDINECEEGSSGCDPLRESCTNLVGGFSCHCLPEYVRVEGECQCELKVSLPELCTFVIYIQLCF